MTSPLASSRPMHASVDRVAVPAGGGPVTPTRSLALTFVATLLTMATAACRSQPHASAEGADAHVAPAASAVDVLDMKLSELTDSDVLFGARPLGYRGGAMQRVNRSFRVHLSGADDAEADVYVIAHAEATAPQRLEPPEHWEGVTMRSGGYSLLVDVVRGKTRDADAAKKLADAIVAAIGKAPRGVATGGADGGRPLEPLMAGDKLLATLRAAGLQAAPAGGGTSNKKASITTSAGKKGEVTIECRHPMSFDRFRVENESPAAFHLSRPCILAVRVWKDPNKPWEDVDLPASQEVLAAVLAAPNGG